MKKANIHYGTTILLFRRGELFHKRSSFNTPQVYFTAEFAFKCFLSITCSNEHPWLINPSLRWHIGLTQTIPRPSCAPRDIGMTVIKSTWHPADHLRVLELVCKQNILLHDLDTAQCIIYGKLSLVHGSCNGFYACDLCSTLFTVSKPFII